MEILSKEVSIVCGLSFYWW